MGASQQRYLAEVLVRRGVVPADRMDELLSTASEKGQSMAEVVVLASQ